MSTQPFEPKPASSAGLVQINSGIEDVIQKRLAEERARLEREEVGLVYELIGPIPAIVSKAHVGPLVQALVGVTEATAAAVTAVVHQEHDAGGALAN